MRRTCILLCMLFINGCMAIFSGCAQIPAHHAQSIQVENRFVAPSAFVTSTRFGQDVPVRIIIPAIHVNAAIEPVGVSSSGDLETPEQHPWTDTGWYTAGSLPGKHGSAVIDGHLDRPGGFPAVFWNLHSIQVGNLVSIVMLSHKVVRFRVVRTAFYAPQAAPLQEIFGNGGGEYLNLITCAGSWVSAERQTTLRMVVYTSLINEGAKGF